MDERGLLPPKREGGVAQAHGKWIVWCPGATYHAHPFTRHETKLQQAQHQLLQRGFTWHLYIGHLGPKAFVKLVQVHGMQLRFAHRTGKDEGDRA